LNPIGLETKGLFGWWKLKREKRRKTQGIASMLMWQNFSLQICPTPCYKLSIGPFHFPMWQLP